MTRSARHLDERVRESAGIAVVTEHVDGAIILQANVCCVWPRRNGVRLTELNSDTGYVEERRGNPTPLRCTKYLLAHSLEIGNLGGLRYPCPIDGRVGVAFSACKAPVLTPRLELANKHGLHPSDRK